MRVRLTKMSANHNALRTPFVEGECVAPPEIGARFTLTGPGLEFGTRLVSTSPVRAIDGAPGLTQTFYTANSRYQLEYLDA